MKKFTLIILTVITIIMLTGMFISEYASVFVKVTLVWAVFIAIYSTITRKKNDSWQKIGGKRIPNSLLVPVYDGVLVTVNVGCVAYAIEV